MIYGDAMVSTGVLKVGIAIRGPVNGKNNLALAA